MVKKITKKKAKKLNPWVKHLMEEKKKHPDKKFKDVMKLAKTTYKK